MGSIGGEPGFHSGTRDGEGTAITLNLTQLYEAKSIKRRIQIRFLAGHGRQNKKGKLGISAKLPSPCVFPLSSRGLKSAFPIEIRNRKCGKSRAEREIFAG